MSAITTAYTKTIDPDAAAHELVAGASATLEGKPTLAILFATSQYDTEHLARAVSDALGGIPMWGGSSSTGVFTDAGWITGEAGAAGLMLVAGRPAAAAVAEVGDDAVAAGRSAARQVLDRLEGPPSALLTLAFMGPEEDLLKGIAEVAPGVPVVGGSSSDHSPAGKFQQFANGHAYTGHFAIAAIGGPVGYAFSNGYRLTGKKVTVTRAEGRKAYELGGRRAMDVYTEWVGKPESEIGGGKILAFSVQYPLLFHKDGVTYSAHPVNANEDGSMDFGAAMSTGMVLELGESSMNGLLSAVGDAVHKAAAGVPHPQGLLLCHCGGRAIALGDRIAEVPGEVEHTLGHLPLIGFLPFGEQGCTVPGIPTHADLSIAPLIFG